MKRLNKLTAVLLSLAMCLSLAAPAFAASFEDLNAAIAGEGESTDSSNYIAGSGHYGYSPNEDGSWGIEAWNTQNTDGEDVRNVQLNENVTQGEGGNENDDATIIVGADDGKVNLGLNGNNITGNGKDTVIEVEEGSNLTITGDQDADPSASPAAEGEPDATGSKNTISNKPSEDTEPDKGANGIDVAGNLTMDGVTITGTDTAVNVEESGTARIEDSTITNNNTGVAFETDRSVTFVGRDNRLDGNRDKNIAGTGKVNFELTNGKTKVTFPVDAEVANTLLANPDNIAGFSGNANNGWIVAKNGTNETGDTYTVVYVTNRTTLEGASDRLHPDPYVSNAINSAASIAKCSTAQITGFVIPKGVTAINGRTFWRCTTLTSIIIPDTVITIGANTEGPLGNVFYGCTALKSITIPNSVTTIGVLTFADCRALESVDIPDSVTTIGWGAFEDCKALKSIDIPEGVTAIGERTFSGCTALGSVTIPASVQSIGKEAFSYCGITSVVIPEGVTTIEEKTFYQCKSLESVTIPDSVTAIRTFKRYGGYDGAFEDCTALKSVTIPNVDTIETETFYGCRALSSVTFGDGVHTIGEKAFRSCGLTSVTIPSNVTSIGTEAFSGCGALTSATLEEGVTSIGQYAFSHCGALESVDIPNSVDAIKSNTFYDCKALKSIDIPSSVTSIGSDAFRESGLASITIPNSVTSIGSKAFYKCEGLSSVDIPNSVTSIGSEAFWGCEALESVTIPNSVTAIGYGTFRYCNALKSVDIPSSVTSIGNYAFKGCGSLKSVSIPDGVTSIGSYAFDNRELISVTVPANVKYGKWSLGYEYAWYYGPRQLQTVLVVGSDAVPEPLKETLNSNTSECSNPNLNVITVSDDGKTMRIYTNNGADPRTFIQAGGEADVITLIGDNSQVAANDQGVVSIPSCRTGGGDSQTVYPTGAAIGTDGSINGAAVTKAPAPENSSGIDVTVTATTGKVNNVDLPEGVENSGIEVKDNGDTELPDGTTINGVRYTGTVIIKANGDIVGTPYQAPVVPGGDFGYDGGDGGLEIDDPAVPLASGPVTRAQFVDYLWRHEGEPASNGVCTFTDVPEDHEFVLALAWAEQNGIAEAYFGVEGHEDGTFEPDELMVPEAVRAILGNFARVIGTNAVAVEDLTTLTGEDGEDMDIAA